MKAQHLRPWLGGVETVAHNPCPQPTRCPEFGDFLQKMVVDIEKERQLHPERVYLEPRFERRLDVGDPIGQREGDLLYRRRAGFADVIATDADRIPARQLL